MVAKYDEDGNLIPEKTPLEEIMEKLNGDDDSSKVKLARLLGDPDIAKIIAARDRGEAIHMTVGDEKPPKKKDDDDAGVDIEDMTNAQFMESMVSKISGIIETKVKETIEPLQTDLTVVKAGVADSYQDKANKAFAEMKETHPELDKFKPKMEAIYKQNPTLSLEQIRVLAYADNDAAPEDTRIVLSSERPTSSSTRPPRVVRKVPLPSGQKGFNQLLAESTAETIPAAIAQEG